MEVIVVVKKDSDLNVEVVGVYSDENAFEENVKEYLDNYFDEVYAFDEDCELVVSKDKFSKYILQDLIRYNEATDPNVGDVVFTKELHEVQEVDYKKKIISVMQAQDKDTIEVKDLLLADSDGDMIHYIVFDGVQLMIETKYGDYFTFDSMSNIQQQIVSDYVELLKP